MSDKKRPNNYDFRVCKTTREGKNSAETFCLCPYHDSSKKHKVNGILLSQTYPADTSKEGFKTHLPTREIEKKIDRHLLGDNTKGTGNPGGDCAKRSFLEAGMLRLVARSSCETERGEPKLMVLWEREWPGLNRQLERVNKGKAPAAAASPAKTPPSCHTAQPQPNRSAAAEGAEDMAKAGKGSQKGHVVHTLADEEEFFEADAGKGKGKGKTLSQNPAEEDGELECATSDSFGNESLGFTKDA
ncbi:hypothetical protein ABBQ38_007997 [Trebouxia sp. C0009 RCD-2024]